MKSLLQSILLIFGVILLFGMYQISCGNQEQVISKIYPKKILRLETPDALAIADKIREEVSVELAEGLTLSLWASDSLMADPIAISMDPKGGIFYTQGNRLEHSEFDIRGHRDWMTESISWQTVEDRRSFLKRTFTDDSEQGKKHLQDLNKDGVLNWKDLTVEKEEIWRISDEGGIGVANQAQLYLQDFNEEISDLANGVEFFDDDVYVAIGPDLWKAEDTDGDGIADQTRSLAHGFAVHIGFGAHGMSGVTMGPDGRLWWGIGDIGMNLVDKNGKRWKYPNQGVIVRCEPDGSNFEVFSAGHRNTHEFVFDKYGNLITEDNDGDHRGERERLVYIINGSDSGWRINWQFGKYTDPDNNKYKVWMDEKLHVPHWEGQAAYILPPIQNYVNGPTGMTYNPGTALSEKWNDHFFIAEFRGSPSNSPIHAFTLKQDGAGFALDQTQIVAKGLLPTGLDFGPDGALYFGDWIDGWGVKHEGRIWKLDVEENEKDLDARRQTKALIEADFSKNELSDLTSLLGHQDMRIRTKAQFELVKRGKNGYRGLQQIAENSSNQLARIHGLWGMGQVTRKSKSNTKDIVPFLADQDEEIIAQAARLIGDVKYDRANEELIKLVNHPNDRIKLYATEALGRIGEKKAIPAIIDLIILNDDKDKWLRHAGVIALGRIGDEASLEALKGHASKAARIAAVVALRRMQSPKVASFLTDQDEFIVTEAARAINDDWSIETAIPALADVLKVKRFTNEALIRRAINANVRSGSEDNLNSLMAYAMRQDAPEELKAEAIAALSTWAKPSVLDRVDGRYRGEIERDPAAVQNIFAAQYETLLNQENKEVVIATLQAISKLKINKAASNLFDLVENHKSAQVKSAAIEALMKLDSKRKKEALTLALNGSSNSVRSTALSLIAETDIEESQAVELFTNALDIGSMEEKQSVFESLSKLKGAEAVGLLGTYLNKLKSKTLDQALALDVIEAVEIQDNEGLIASLKNYQDAKPKSDPLALYREALIGGDAQKGQEVFYRNEAAQCVRCHSIFEWGGDAGPVLAGVGSRLNKEQLLESLIEPSATIADGYALAMVELNDGSTVSGFIESESKTEIAIKLSTGIIRSVSKNDIAEREDAMSSMPSVKRILSKKQIRDVVAFLSGLKDHSL